MRARIAIVRSTNSPHDSFRLEIHDENSILVASVIFLANTRDILHSTGGAPAFTGKKTPEGFYADYELVFNFPNRTWSATMDGLPLVTNAAFEAAASGPLGSITFLWVTEGGSGADGDGLDLDSLRIASFKVPPSELPGIHADIRKLERKIKKAKKLKNKIKKKKTLKKLRKKLRAKKALL